MAGNERIRPFPSHLSQSVQQFIMCKYLPRCSKGKECTYAHSEEERKAWNDQLRQSRKRARSCYNTVVLKKPKTAPALEETVSVASTSSEFVKTKVYQEPLEQIQSMGDGVNNIQIFGPKGTGKTYALLMLKEVLPDTSYIEYAESVEFDKKILLIDNAQLFTYDIKCLGIRRKKVIAAFSPGAKLVDGCKALTKRCGDGCNTHFCWRPFMYNEVKCLANKLGFTVRDKTNLEQKQISEHRLKMIFCKTNGNPRYIRKYFTDKNLNYMVRELDEQYRSMLKVNDLGGPEKICRSFLTLLKTGECELWHTPSVLGGAYCNDELGKWKLAHSYFAFRAIEYLEGDAFWGDRWQQLESITQLMLLDQVSRC